MVNQDVLVAGGGIGGLAAALALARTGQRVTVLERAHQFSEVGAGIQLGPNALHALQALGVLDAVLATACQPEAIVVRHARTGRSISRMLLGAAVRQRYGQGYATVHRADLHHALLQAVQAQPSVQLCLGEEASSVQQSTTAQKQVHVQVHASQHGDQPSNPQTYSQTSPPTRQAHAVIAADGVWSCLRQAVFADGRPRATGHAAYRALLPIAQVPPELQANLVGVWWGRDVHVVHYPVRSGAFLNIVVLSEQSAAQALPQWASPASSEAVLRSVQGACPALRALLESVTSNAPSVVGAGADGHAPTSAWQSWHLYDRPAARSWVQGQVALLGDAAHPMLPYLAQGAAMALEDAVVLAASTAQHSHWSAALQHYQSLRKARCERVVATARRNGRIFHLPQPWAMARDAVLALKGTEVLGMPWLYGARGA